MQRGTDTDSDTLRKPSTSSLVATHQPIPTWSRRAGILVICWYVVWAFVIPIKNVVMIDLPTLRVDTTNTETGCYVYDAAVDNSSLKEFDGRNVASLLQKVISIVVGNRPVRDQLEALGSFDIDTIHQLLTPDDFQTIEIYYSLLVQATEFPGSLLTPRPRHFAATSNDVPKDALGLWIQPINGSDPWLLALSCASENTRIEGTRCLQSGTDYVCIDFPVAGEKRTHIATSLDASRVDSGFANSIGLLFVIETFHIAMDQLFSTKSWNKTLEGLTFLTSPSQAQTALNNGFSSVFRDGIAMVQEKFAKPWYSIRVNELETRTLESCFISEIIAMAFYTKAFVFSLVEDALIQIDSQPYGASVNNRLTIPRDRIDVIMAPVLGQKLFISSGARVNKAISVARTKIFTGLELTSVTRATTRVKADKRLASIDGFGSSLRMLLMTAQYPEYYSYYEHTEEIDASSSRPYDMMTFSLLGGAMAGLNTFKSDWWGNTMGVWKLAELPSSSDLPRHDTWWDEEEKFAAWFQRLEQSSDAPFFALAEYIDIEATGIALDDNSVTRCHRAFYKTLVKIMWLSLLTSSGLPSYLIFMSNSNGGAKAWFVNMIKRNSLVGELMSGARYSFPYGNSATTRKDDGSAWVVVPMLQAMITHLGRHRTAEMILREFNASFPLFIATEYGLVHFLDSAQCKVGFHTNNVSAEKNTLDKITKAFYPSIEKFIHRAIDDHAELYEKMASTLALEDIEMVEIPKEMLLGSPSTPLGIEIVGSPVLWRPTAFTAGMLKFWPADPPPKTVIAAYRNSTVCFRTLELRYLNESTRCWVEPNSVTRTRVAYQSDGLRYLIWSNWSISWVLNSISFCIALQFLRRFVIAYKTTQFRCVSFWVASQFNFQSVGVLSFAQVLLMTMSSLPLMIAYHLPTDPIFMDKKEVRMYPKFVRDIVVSTSATWFIRIGFDSVNQISHHREYYPWFNSPRLRIAAWSFVVGVRLATPDVLDNANYEMFKLLATCVGSVWLGVLCAIVPLYLHRKSQRVMPKGSMATLVRLASSLAPSMKVKEQSIVVHQLHKQGMALNHHGVLGFSQYYGWSLTGLLVEGWEIIESKPTNGVIIVKGRCKVPLEVDGRGRIKQCLL